MKAPPVQFSLAIALSLCCAQLCLAQPSPIFTSTSPDDKLVTLGERLFLESCLKCHEAEKALTEDKTFDEWMETIEEMAAEEDAQIPRSSFKAIATFLAAHEPLPKSSLPEPELSTPMEMLHDPPMSGASAIPTPTPSANRAAFDPQLVRQGQTAFQNDCLQCHDAERATNKRKSLAGWMVTVRRMARLDDANVPESDIRPIATYLASLNPAAESAGGVEEAAVSDLNLSGTLSTLWRGGNDNLENSNFFVDAWVRADWQPQGPLSGRVTACTSCHSDQTGGGGFTLELVEAVATFDLLYKLRQRDNRPEHCRILAKAELKAGRIVVPFGAFNSMSHPGSYRTVTHPLMYNMGRQVNAERSRPPVLPMPYSDEGIDIHTAIPVGRDLQITLDSYAVNGLQGGGSGVNYTRSRSYADNNRHAGYGSRGTIGNSRLRFGGSVMAGRLEDEGAADLNYHLAGADATARFCNDNARFYFEYAIRRNDTLFGQRQIAYGTVSELEFLLIDDPNISALFRYDTLEHRDFFGDASIDRFTWGISTAIAGTTLILNHEHWQFSGDSLKDTDVFGVRWVATF